MQKFYNKELLNSQKDINLGGQGLLHYAVKGKQLEIVKFLIDEGINIDQVDNKGATPLHYVASIYADQLKEIDYAIMELLLSSNASTEVADIHGNTCLWAACHASKGMKFDMVRLIMRYKPNINHMNKYGKSPISLAKERNYTELIIILESKT